jgi:hypothetical protein
MPVVITSRAVIRAGLAMALEPLLVDQLLDAHAEAKSNYHLGGLRLSEVEGGRFCEAAFRLLQRRAFGTFDPLGSQLDADATSRGLANLPRGSHPDAVRIHIPRALRVVYDIRNSRDAAHLADDIDPNRQDATLVVGILDWVLAEFVRLYHTVDADAAHRIVEDLVSRRAPVIQDFDGFLKVLRTDLGATAHCLVLLYQRGSQGATLGELNEWARPPMRANLRRTLAGLVHARAWVHQEGDRYRITRSGEQEVDARAWLVGQRGTARTGH